MVQKSTQKIICLLTLCIIDLYAVTEYLAGISTFTPRAQDINAARDLVGWHPFIHVPDKKKNYVTFALTPQYNQSLRPKRISLALFNTDVLLLEGSLIPNRNPLSLLADYFGLSPSFSSIITIKPLIQNVLADIGFYAGFDQWVKGLYFQIHAPAVWTKWNLELHEEILNTGSATPFPPGYMATQALPAPVESFTNAIKGHFSYGDVEQLDYGVINGPQKKGGLAAIDAALGYDFALSEFGHAGLNFRVTIPTGTRTKGLVFFEPRIGFGKNWQWGVGFTGQALMWEKEGDQQLYFFSDINLTHYCKARQRRAFDFTKNGFLSRYILLKEFNDSGAFDGNVLPAINVTTLLCDVHVNIQADIVFMFGYTYKNFTFDIGYNGWIRSKERITLKEGIPVNKYGFKGIQNVIDPSTGMLSNLTESNATIHDVALQNQAVVADDPSPVFITTSGLNLDSAASPLLITHKLFWHFSNAWPEWKEKATPFVGIGAEIEFEGINERDAMHPDRTTMGQASIWLKGGFFF